MLDFVLKWSQFNSEQLKHAQGKKVYIRTWNFSFCSKFLFHRNSVFNFTSFFKP